MKKEFQLWTRDILWPKTISGIVIKDKREKNFSLVLFQPLGCLLRNKEIKKRAM